MMDNYKFKKKEAYFVDGHVIERIIETEFDFDEYSIVAAEELSNYQRWVTYVGGEFNAENVKNKKKQFCTKDYLNFLGKRGKIPLGLYVIDTSW
jgi:hypothetical protein